VEKLYLVRKHLKLAIAVGVVVFFSGCANTSSNRNNIHALEKRVIELNEIAKHHGSPTPESNGGFEDGKYLKVEIYPVWVVSPEKYFSYAVGVSCRGIAEHSYQDEINGKLIARDQAVLDLFQKGSAQQKMFAKETLSGDGDDADYGVVIKKQTYGQVGRNELAKEGFFRIVNQKKYCIAVKYI